ncbi:TPA: BrnA antitoxin family protein [Burkholderia cenocepacia]|nr:BrnA antitoxin family protein [Burkholderia cenocepacia]HDR9814325.1 BrnA antitoxin family protein [Burkholderia cenocepacia]HDR9821256.1 BrnA antitoxin family protein [Burkholderia cenocepacia]HDR9829243.1 BrnA antitoxin family protein [Burkholderia cenocepacia]
MKKAAKFIRNTPEEEAAIARGIAADPDARELGDEEIDAMEPFVEVVAKKFGHPKLEHPKEQVSIRYDADILAAFRAEGPGWQTRMNDALRDWLKKRRA